jgi:hypothetical protein
MDIIADIFTLGDVRAAVVFADRKTIEDAKLNEETRTFVSQAMEMQGVVVVLVCRQEEGAEPLYDGPPDVVALLRKMGWVRLRYKDDKITSRYYLA